MLKGYDILILSISLTCKQKIYDVFVSYSVRLFTVGLNKEINVSLNVLQM